MEQMDRVDKILNELKGMAKVTRRITTSLKKTHTSNEEPEEVPPLKPSCPLTVNDIDLDYYKGV